MTKVFISYRFTGEDKVELVKTMTELEDTIKEKKYKVYSTIHDNKQFANENWSGKQILRKAYDEIDNSEKCLFFVRKEDISQGMLLELGYAMAKEKELILAIKKDIKKSIYRRQIDKVIEFENFEELKEKLSKNNW